MTPHDGDDGLSVRAPGEAAEEPPVPLSRRVRGWLRDLTISVVGLSVLWVGVGAMRAPSFPEELPELSLPNLDGAVVDLAALHGQPVIVNFWATWCGPCRMELPELVHFANGHPDVPVLFVAVDGSLADLRSFAAAHDLPSARVLRADVPTKAAWGVSTLPMTVAVSAAGKVRAAHVGIVALPQLWWWTL